MKVRKNDWLDTETMTVHYGIDGMYNGKWHYLCCDDKPLFFGTSAERDTKMKELLKA